MHANEMQAHCNKHHKVSSHINVYQNTHDSRAATSHAGIVCGWRYFVFCFHLTLDRN